MRLHSLFRICVTVVLLAASSGCALFGFQSEPEEYVVQRGDTLYSIADTHDIDYRELAAWNGIGAPYRIRPGQVLLLEAPDDFVYAPVAEPQRPPRQPAPEPAAIDTTPLPTEDRVNVSESPPEEPLAPGVSSTAPESPPIDPAAAPPPETVAMIPPPGSMKWRWPVEGELLPPAPGSSPGIDIGGRLGQSVRAAASGKVVYSGGGLQGYGQLVIVKHEDNYLSAYGYNRRLLVRQGDEVHVGQPIAEMGEGPERRPALHFEIRRSGKALDPLQLLPAPTAR